MNKADDSEVYEDLMRKWRQPLAAAKRAWGKLTDIELLKLKSRAEELPGLFQERYALTRKAAGAQVKSFFDKHSF